MGHSTTVVALVVASAVQAEQFAVRLDAAYDGANPQLLEALKVSEIESFSDDGAHYVVLDAPSEAYVEAFVFAIRRDALELNKLDADWTNPVMDDLSMSQRLRFLRSVECEFCTS